MTEKPYPLPDSLMDLRLEQGQTPCTAFQKDFFAKTTSYMIPLKPSETNTDQMRNVVGIV